MRDHCLAVMIDSEIELAVTKGTLMPKSKNKEKTAFLLAAYGAVFFQAGTDLSAAN